MDEKGTVKGDGAAHATVVILTRRMAHGIIFFMLMILLPPLWAMAADTEPPGEGEPVETGFEQGADPDSLIRYAYRHNPDIAVARENWRATIEKYRVATGYPDPQLMVTYFPDPIETRLGPQDWNASISQMIPFPGKLSRAGEVVQAEAEAARLDLDRTVRDVILSIRESCHELEYIRQAREVAKQNAALVDHLRKVAETTFADDRATLLDVVKAQSQVGQLRYDQILLQELEQTEIVRLNGLLNRSPDALIGDLAPIPFVSVKLDLMTMYRLAEAKQEEILIARAREKMAEAKVALEGYNNYPELKVGVVYSSIGEPDVLSPPKDAGRDAIGIQAGISIPLWFGKNSGRVGQARAELQKARSMKVSRVNQARTQIRAVFFKLENARRLVALYENELIPQAAKSMEMAETWFSQNEASFSDFIETRAVWYNFQLARARARADYGKALAKLERLVGQPVTIAIQPDTETSESEEVK